MSIVYPNSLTILGQTYAPSVYADDLQHLLIGSSGEGGVKIRIEDINALDIRAKGAGNPITQIAALNSQSIEIIPADTDNTLVLGSLTIDDGSTGSNQDYQVYSTNATNNPNGHFFEQQMVINDLLRVQEVNAGNATLSNTASLTPLGLTITNPDDNDTTTNIPVVVLQSTDVGGSLLNQFQIIGPDSQDTSASTGSGQGSLGGAKTVLQVNGSNAGYATDQLVLYGNGEVQATDFISGNIRSLNTDTDNLTYNAASHIFQDDATGILTILNDGTHTSLSAPAVGAGATRDMRFEATSFVFTDTSVDYLTIDTTGTNTTITANDTNILELVPSDASDTVILGNLTISNGPVSPDPREDWLVYSTTQPNGHWFNEPVNISQAQINLQEPNPITGSNNNSLSATGMAVTVPDDDSANTQIWTDISMQTTFDSAGATTGPLTSGFRIRGPNSSETGTYDNSTTLDIGTTVLAVAPDGTTYNTDQLVLYGNGEVRADNFITSNIQTFEPSTDAMQLRAASYTFQDDSTNILVIDSTGTNTTLTTGDTNIFQIVPTDTDVTTILGALTIDNGTAATSNADFQVYKTTQTNGHFFEEDVVVNDLVRVQEVNAGNATLSNTASLTPLSLTLINPDDNDATTNIPKILLQSSNVTATELSQFQIIGPDSQWATDGGGKTILQVAGAGGTFASDQLVLYGDGEVQANNFITSNIQTRDVSADTLNIDAALFQFQDNSVNILSIDRTGTTETVLTANSTQQFTIVPTDTANTVNAGSLSLFDGSVAPFENYQVITTDTATNNPLGLAIDVGSGHLVTSNIKVNTIESFTSSPIIHTSESTFNLDVNVLGSVNVTGDVNILGQINSSNVNNLNVNDLEIRLAFPENPATQNEKTVGDPTTSGLYVWSIPTGATQGDAEDAAGLYDKTILYKNNSGFNTTGTTVAQDLRSFWEIKPAIMKLTHTKSDLSVVTMGFRVTDNDELQIFKEVSGVVTVMATFAQKNITTPITDPN